MKTCRRCKKNKELSEFYSHSQMKDGHLNICIECTKKRVAEHRERNIEKIRRYDRIRGRTEERLKNTREMSRMYRAIGKAYAVDWIKRNPEKRAAHIKLGNAVRDGRIKKQPCVACGEKKSDGHHGDYSKPLNVIWLCRRCHARLHRKYED